MTITYSVHVNNPATGDKVAINTVTSAAAGSTCPPGTTDPACRVTIPVLTPALTMAKTASPQTAVPGGTVTYTITVTNTGQIPYTAATANAATVTDDLTGVTSNAAYQGNAAAAPAGASTISLSYAAPSLTWTGNLPLGAAVTITYTVIVNSGTAGRSLTNTVTSAAAGSNCVTGTEPGCTATVGVVVAPGTLTFTNQAGVNTAGGATAGAAETYTITVANAAASPYTGASFSDDLTGVLAHASYGNDASDHGAGGTFGFTSPNLTWSGDVPASGSVTITFTVAVSSAVTSSTALSSTLTSASDGTNCPQTGGTGDPRCSTSVGVAQLAISASTNVTTTTPGGVVRYTFTFTNTGSCPTPASRSPATRPAASAPRSRTATGQRRAPPAAAPARRGQAPP